MWLLKSLLRQIYSVCGRRILQVACSKLQEGYSYAGSETKQKPRGTTQIAKQEQITFTALLSVTLRYPLFTSLHGAGGICTKPVLPSCQHSPVEGAWASVLCHISLLSASGVSLVTALTGCFVLRVKSSLVATATFQKEYSKDVPLGPFQPSANKQQRFCVM